MVAVKCACGWRGSTNDAVTALLQVCRRCQEFIRLCNEFDHAIYMGSLYRLDLTQDAFRPGPVYRFKVSFVDGRNFVTSRLHGYGLLPSPVREVYPDNAIIENITHFAAVNNAASFTFDKVC